MSDFPIGTITFLFTDMQDSSRLWEQYPDAMQRALKRHDEIIESLSGLHHGQVVRPRGEGDSRFVVFRRALDGVKAAAAIQQALHNENWPDGIPLLVRMGIHTGEGQYRDGDYYGAAVNRGARLRGIAHGGQVLLSRSTYELVQDNLPEDFEAINLGQRPLSGMERPETIYQLTAPGLTTDFPPIIEEKQPPQTRPILPDFLDSDSEPESTESQLFVGRENELARLGAALDQANQEEGQVLFIEGEAGQGKTALMDEFSRRAQAKHSDLIITRGNCNAHSGMGDPYLPFREIMGMLTGNIESMFKSGRITTDHAQRLWELMPRSVDAILDKAPSLLNIFIHGDTLLNRVNTAMPDDATRQGELQDLVQRKKSAQSDIDQTLLFEQYVFFLLTLSSHVPLVLLLDDMQWADRASIDLFFHLARRIEGHPILLAAAYRPDEVAVGRNGDRHPLEQVVNELKRSFGDITLNLGAADPDQGSAFIDDLLDSEPNNLGQDFRRALLDHTGGHPLFTVELLRAMQERGDLVQGEDGEWTEGQRLDWDRLPARVEAVIEERIARLEEDIRELLAVASVEGEDFTAQVLARVQDMKERKLLRELSRELSKRHRLVHEAGEVETRHHILSKYKFVHHLFQRYLYNGLSAAERRLLHGEIARVLEDIFKDEVERVAVQLAYHNQRAQLHDKAARYLRLAGNQARTSYANQEAIQYYTDLLELLPEKDEERFQVLSLRAEVYDVIADREAQLKDAREMLSIAQDLGEKSFQVDALLVEADAQLDSEHLLAEEPARKAMALAEKIGDPVRKASALRRLGWSAWLKFNYASSRDYLQKAANIFLASDNPRKAAGCLNLLSLASDTMYDQQEALQAAQEAIRLSRQIEDPRLEATGLRRLAIIYLNLKETENALPLAEKALTLHRQVGDVYEEAHDHNVIGLIYGRMGRWSELESHLFKSLQLAHKLRATTPILFASVNLAASHFRRQGNYEGAIHHFDQEIKRAMGMEDDWLIGSLHFYKASFLREIGQFKASFNAYETSSDILQKHAPQGYYRVNSLAYMGLLHTRLGQPGLAKEKFDRSLKMSKSIRNPVKQSEPILTWGQDALILGNKDRIEKAHRLIEERIETILDSTHWEIKQQALNTSSLFLLERGQAEAALERSSHLMEIVDSHPSIKALQDFSYTHSQALRALNREDEADQFLQRAYDYIFLVADNFENDDWRRTWLEDARRNQEILKAAKARGIA